jgi:DNA repair exonuclease SbcCD ATPase subunit
MLRRLGKTAGMYAVGIGDLLMVTFGTATMYSCSTKADDPQKISGLEKKLKEKEGQITELKETMSDYIQLRREYSQLEARSKKIKSKLDGLNIKELKNCYNACLEHEQTIADKLAWVGKDAPEYDDLKGQRELFKIEIHSLKTDIDKYSKLNEEYAKMMGRFSKVKSKISKIEKKY